MTETEFFSLLAPFTEKTAAELDMADDLTELGADSVDILEFTMKVEDAIGQRGIEFTASLESVQDLFDCILDAAEK